MFEALSKQDSINQKELAPWKNFSELVQATRHVGSTTRYGDKSQSQCQVSRSGNSGQKRKQDVAGPSNSDSAPPGKSLPTVQGPLPTLLIAVDLRKH